MAISLPIISEFNAAGINKAIAEFKKLEGAGAKAAFAIKKAALPATAALAGLAAVGAKAVDAASDLAESQSKVQVIFGESSASVEKFAETAAKSFGQSKQEVLNAAGTFGTFGKAAGLNGEKLAAFSNDFTALASDLASFNNTTPQEAIEAIGAALRGESEPIRKYGVLLNDAALKAEAFALGISDGKAPLTAQQKILAAQSAIIKQTTAAQGDFARTSGGLANQQRILKANLANTTASIGQAFLPIVQKLLPVLQSFADFVQKNTGLLVTLGIVVGTVAAAILAVNAGLAIFNTIQALTTALNTALSASFSALYVATGVGVILAIVAALVVLQAKFNIFGKIIDEVKGAFSRFYSTVKTVLDLLASAFSTSFAAIRNIAVGVFDGLAAGFKATINAIIGAVEGGLNLAIKGLNKALDLIDIAAGPFINFGTIPSVKLPRLAEGGIVTSPTIAMIGERGPEAVVPLSKMGAMGSTVNVYMPAGANGDDVVRALQQWSRSNGALPLATTTSIRR